MNVNKYTIDLSEQMAVCDANYIRLLKLLGKMKAPGSRTVELPQLGNGCSKGQISVNLEVLEDFKYTSTISIRQMLANDVISTQENRAHYNAPEMIIRVYHDAKTAEVTSYQNHRHFKAIYPVPNQFMYHSDEKEQLNLFLAEWLNLCINEGLSSRENLHLEKICSIQL
ncbi:MAG: DUF1249 domain-containing protein [Gammaproteobacteria bacterium]|nr:DUF1249 domain-containing protein [Gammaproteobacteria bacterium]